MTAVAEPSGSSHVQECVLHGSILEGEEAALLQRLRGLCDPAPVLPFREHEMVFELAMPAASASSVPSATRLRLRRALNERYGADRAAPWLFRYVGAAQSDTTKRRKVATVRKVLDSLVQCGDMMALVKALGFKMKYEYVCEGSAIHKGRLRASVFRLQRVLVPGDVEKREQLTGSLLVELAVCTADGADPTEATDALTHFAQQLRPLVHMEVVDY